MGNSKNRWKINVPTVLFQLHHIVGQNGIKIIETLRKTSFLRMTTAEWKRLTSEETKPAS